MKPLMCLSMLLAVVVFAGCDIMDTDVTVIQNPPCEQEHDHAEDDEVAEP